MKTMIRISIVMVTCCACAMSQPENLTLGEGHSHMNLLLFPVHANRTFLENRKNLGSFLTLKEAVDAGKVLVTEHVAPGATGREAQPDVNTLLIENLSSDTVLILNGEMVKGGHQDRMVTTDVVLAPRSGKLDLSVFCVEQGRWTGDSVEFMVTEQSLPPNSVRKAAAVTADQEVVWDDIKVNLDIEAVDSPSDAPH